MPTFSEFGSGASILALSISIYIAFKVRNLKKSIVYQSLAKEYLDNIVEKTSNISDLLDNFEDNRNQIGSEIHECVPYLKFHYASAKESKAEVRKSLSLARKYIRNNKRKFHIIRKVNTEGDVWNVYHSLLQAAESVKVEIKQREMRGLANV